MINTNSAPSRKVHIHQQSYRLIPSHFPPIALFENLLDANDLEAAYALESLTNDRLQDQVGNIALIAEEDRITGRGSTAIMAAFTHTGIASRFTPGHYGVYYAGLDLQTAMAEAKFSRSRFLQATAEPAQVLTMRCYHCSVDAKLVDLTNNKAVHHPTSFTYAQQVAKQLKDDNEFGILYRSVRNSGGHCIAALRPTALIPPANQAEHYQFHWDGDKISHVLEVSEHI